MATEYTINNSYIDGKHSGYSAGSNGLSGFKTWECYMLLKYGNPSQFGYKSSNQYEYLIELPIYPESVNESIQASWGTQKVIGRSAPLAAYTNTDLKSVNFTLELHRDFLTGSYSHTATSAPGYIENAPKSKSQLAGYQKQTDRGPFGTRAWYVSINKMLQMACYPQYTDTGMIPPTVYFVFGQMILKGFVESYSTTWNKPIINTFYAWNTVNINMACYPDTIISASEMLEGEGAMSTQNTYNTKFPSSKATSSDVMARNLQRSNARSAGSIGGQVTDR